MFQECRHILTSGHKCKAAALRGKAYCYYHIASRRFAAKKITHMDPLEFPSIEDAAGVQIAINQVLRALGNWRIEPRHAGVYFYGLHIAARLARKSAEKPSQTVRELSENSASESAVTTESAIGSEPAPEGKTGAETGAGESAISTESAPFAESFPCNTTALRSELAPAKTVCEPPLDCLYCHRRDFCPDWELHRSKAIELLARIRAEAAASEENPGLEFCSPGTFDQ